MPTLFCCILNCESESVNCKKRKIFYRLPQNSDRKQLWLNQIGERIKYGTVSSNSRICNSHFATGKPNLDSSHVDYMPTIFPWSTKEEKMKSFKSVEEYESKIKELEQKILAKAFLNASSGSKLSQESSTTRYELPENDICSKLIIDTDPPPTSDFNKNRQQKPIPAKINSNSEINGIEQKNIVNTNSLEKSISSDPGKIPIFKESFIPCHTNQHNTQQNLNTQSTIQLVPDNSVSIKSNLLNYLLSSIARVNMANNNSDLSKSSLSVNVSMPTGPLNLSQTYNKLDDQSMKQEKVNEMDTTKKEPLKKESISQPNEPNLDTNSNVSHIKNSINKSQTPPDRTGTPSEETTSRSCTCTKSSCLKLYCECFANGNLCCSGCTCINCRNNDNYKEERAKIVSSYLERDPWVFNSKIENKDVGKKHSKGCNCLKSSCLKNYCECFENKVFCSSLCRCRMCYNNEEHTQHNNKDDTKIYASSHTSESLSVMSENSPRNINRKRKKSSLKTNDIYEDVSSNESEDEVNTKRCQLDSEAISVENDKRSNRSINSMEIPPVLPQEDDFTEEELALMVKFREQRTEKPSNLKTECMSPPAQCNQSFLNTVANVITPSAPPSVSITTSSSPLINIPAHLDSNLLLTLSKSLAVANLGLNGLNVVNTTVQDTKRPTGIDLLGLLATQQLMVSRPSNEVGNLNCISVPQNCNHVIPINLTQIPQPPPPAPSCLTQISQLPSTVVTQSKIVTTSPTSVTSLVCQSKPKLSTEDYVRKHIEAAERAVRADYMRKDSSNYKKPITKHKIKIDPFPPVNQKPSQIINNIKPPGGGTANMVNTNDISRLIINQPPMFNKAQYEEQNNGLCTGSNSTMTTVPPHLTNGGSGIDQTTISSLSSDTNPPASNLGIYNWIPVPTNNAAVPPSLSTQNSSSILHTVQINCQSNSLSENHDQVNKSNTDSQYRDKHVTRGKITSLRHSFQSLRNEIRSLKFHMRADQSRLRRLEKNLHQLRNQIGK